MSRPFIYLAFANQQNDHLPLLKEEMDKVKDCLRPLEQREFIKLEREESTNTNDIINTITTYADDIAIFHYSGHAEEQLLLLEDTAAQSQGLAMLLGNLKQLKLVFLNGCSTKGHIEQLFAAGVPAVIGTSVPIADAKATVFSAAFYRALANKQSIQRAFQLAQGSVETKFTRPPVFEINRGIKIKSRPETQELPWALYTNPALEAPEELLNWRLPYYRSDFGLSKSVKSYIDKSLQLDKYIVLVLDEMCKYNKDIYSQMLEVVGGQEVKKDASTYMDLVIRNFPWVIGSQLQLLRQFRQPNQARLEQLLSTYVITTQVLYYILLSNLWDEIRRKAFTLPPGFLEYHAMRPDNILQFNFLSKIKHVYSIMLDFDCHFFVPEFEKFCQSLSGDSLAVKAWYYLEEELDDIHRPSANIQKACIQAEQALSVLLREAAFLANYKMLTVRNISLENPRGFEVQYEIDFGLLNAVVNTSLGLLEDEERRHKDSYSNCDSVVLAASEEDLSQTLNLSPFIIDKNTYLDNTNIDVFMYAYEKEEKFYFLAVKHNIFLALKNEKGTDLIHTEMTENDFVEGRNINNAIESFDDSGFSEAFGLHELEEEEDDSPKVFEVLAYQFKQFKYDLIS